MRWILPLLLCAACARLGREPPRTEVILLGTGTPNADPERSGPSTAVVVDGFVYLVDCGPGVVRRASAAGLPAKKLERVFLTHLHTDHTVGLADLIFTPWVLEREAPLHVWGPEGTKAMVKSVAEAYAQDVRIRIDGLEPANATGHRVNVHEISAGEVYRDDRVTVTAILVDHGSWKQAFAFVFETPDGKIVLSGDCRPSEGVLEAARGADLLVHEVYSHARFLKRPPIWQKYHSSFHTSTLELAAIAKQAKPKLLVLNHQLFWGASEEDLLEEIATIYDGEVVSGNDLDRFALNRSK